MYIKVSAMSTLFQAALARPRAVHRTRSHHHEDRAGSYRYKDGGVGSGLHSLGDVIRRLQPMVRHWQWQNSSNGRCTGICLTSIYICICIPFNESSLSNKRAQCFHEISNMMFINVFIILIKIEYNCLLIIDLLLSFNMFKVTRARFGHWHGEKSKLSLNV